MLLFVSLSTLITRLSPILKPRVKTSGGVLFAASFSYFAAACAAGGAPAPGPPGPFITITGLPGTTAI